MLGGKQSDLSELTPDLDPVALLREHFPWWTELASLPLLLIFVAIVSWCVAYLVFRMQPGLSELRPDLHWVERAQLAHPFMVSVTPVVVVNLILAIVAARLWSRDLQLVSRWFLPLWPLLAGMVSIWTSAGAGALIESRVRGRERRIERAEILLLTNIVRNDLPLVVVALAWGWMDPTNLGESLVIWGAAVLVSASLLRGLGLRVARLVGWVDRAGGRLREIFDREAERLGRCDLSVLRVRSGVAAMDACSPTGTVLFTDGLMKFSDDELAVLARLQIQCCDPAARRVLRSLSGLPLLASAAALPLVWAQVGLLPALGLALLASVPFVNVVTGRDEETPSPTPDEEERRLRVEERLHEENLIAVHPANRGFESQYGFVDKLEPAGLVPDWPIPDEARPPRAPITWTLVLGLIAGVSVYFAAQRFVAKDSDLALAALPMTREALWARVTNAESDREQSILAAAAAKRFDRTEDYYRVAAILRRTKVGADGALPWFGIAEERLGGLRSMRKSERLATLRAREAAVQALGRDALLVLR